MATPSELADVFARVEATGRRVTSVRLHPDDFEALRASPGLFDLLDAIPPSVAFAWGAAVYLDVTLGEGWVQLTGVDDRPRGNPPAEFNITFDEPRRANIPRPTVWERLRTNELPMLAE